MDFGHGSAGDFFWSRTGQWLVALLAVYAVGTLALLFFRIDLRLIVAATPIWVIPAFMGLSSVGLVIRIARWLLLARIVNLKVPARGLLTVYVGGFLMNLTPGRVGELWRSWILLRGWELEYRRSLPLLICDRLLDLCALLLLAALGSGLGFGFDWPAILCTLAAAALLALIAVPGWVRRGIKVLWACVGRPRPRLFAALLSVCRNVARILKPASFLKLLSLSLIAWGMEAVALHLLMPTVGGELPLRAAAATLGLANVAGAITPLPGGVGGQELTMTFLIKGVAANSARERDGDGWHHAPEYPVVCSGARTTVLPLLVTSLHALTFREGEGRNRTRDVIFVFARSDGCLAELPRGAVWSDGCASLGAWLGTLRHCA